MRKRSRTYTCAEPITLNENGDYVWGGQVLNHMDQYHDDIYQANIEPLNSAKRVEDIAPSGDI